jgi:hypothetical protein
VPRWKLVKTLEGLVTGSTASTFAADTSLDFINERACRAAPPGRAVAA